MKKKVVLILGLSRIGSTILDLTLGSQHQLVGLGELQELFRPEWQRYNNKIFCTCGKTNLDCPFWKDICVWLQKNETKPLKEKYQYCFNAFFKYYDSSFIPIDSSKNLSALNSLMKIDDIDLKIIFLIRDVRAWTISKLDDRLKNPEKFRENGFYIKNLIHNIGFIAKFFSFMIPWLTKQPFYYFFSWYYQNKKIKNQLKKINLPYYQISYESFALEPEKTLRQLNLFINDSNDCSLDIERSKSHIITGNPKRNDTERKKNIHYDYRWFSRNEWLISYFFFYWIKNYNLKQVYMNTGFKKE